MKINNQHLLQNFGQNGKLNIALVSDAFYPLVGGATVVVDSLARQLMQLANVVVIAPYEKYPDTAPYAIIRCKGFKISDASGCLALVGFDCKFKKFIKTLPIDIVHAHSVFGLAVFFQKYAKRRGIPFVLSGHSKFSEEYSKIIKNKQIRKIFLNHAIKVLNRCDEVWPVSNGCQAVYQQMGVLAPTRVFRNATNLQFPPNPEKLIEHVNKKYALAGKPNVLLFLSRLDNPTKNIEYILRAGKVLLERGMEVHIVMVGDGSDRKFLQNLAAELGISNNTTFTGVVTDADEKMGIYLRSDLFVFPSVVDTSGLVVLEAAAMQTPSVMIENSTSAECAVHGKNAFLCKLGVGELADCMQTALADKQILAKVARGAQKDLGESWQSTANSMLLRYQELIAQKSAN